MRRHHGRDFLLGAVLGSSLGALTAVMLKSKKGRHLQKEMLHKYHEFENMVKGFAKEKQKKARKTIRKAARRAKHKIKAARKKI